MKSLKSAVVISYIYISYISETSLSTCTCLTRGVVAQGAGWSGTAEFGLPSISASHWGFLPVSSMVAADRSIHYYM